MEREHDFQQDGPMNSKRPKRPAQPDPQRDDDSESVLPARKEDELATVRRQTADLREENLRLRAEMQNLRKRTEREQDETVRFAESELARELLPVLDSLERARASASAAHNIGTLADGVRIASEHFLKVLQGHHIEPIAAAGQPFDPSLHKAVRQQPSDDYPAGTVLQELARGYIMYERVLRPSQVVVSSGPAWASPAP
jgi:molecular chaperone GrpE